MIIRRSGFTVLVILAASTTSHADSRLLRFDDLQKRLGSPDLRLLDTRSRADYDRSHAPGAVWVNSKAAQEIASRPGGLTDRKAWQTWIEPLGIGPKTEVVIFDGSRQLDAARLWWILSYLGVANVALLDGNFPLWVRENRPTSTDSGKIEPGKFQVEFQAGQLATREDVLNNLKSGRSKIIDARTIEEYTGAKKSSTRGGHIPAACRLEWTDLVDGNGHFLEASALRARLSELGVKPGDPVITHCQGGGRASVDAFAISRLGHSTRNFYLGWSDWGNATETPVLEGSEPGKKP